MEEYIMHGVLLITSLLSIAVFSSMILNKIHFPYTIGLVIVGAVFGLASMRYEALAEFHVPELNPGIILYLILPALIFDAAINIDFGVLKRNIIPILILAVVGILISALVVAAGISYVTPIPFIAALVFGALISATDPVAVIALFNEIGAPKRLITLIDGESIFNDATAIVLFNIVIVLATTATATVNYTSAILTFFSVLLGGLAIGTIIGALGSLVNRLGRNNLLLQITVSLIMAYVSFIVADHFFKVSGVMSTLAAGLVMRGGLEKTIKRSNIETLEHFWEYFSFVANSIVFLLLGVTQAYVFSNSKDPNQTIKYILYMIPIVIIARIACIYFLIPIFNKFCKNKEKNAISWSYQAILLWGGLRGAVPVALVLAIPEDFPNRELIIQFTFAFIMFTLLFQGTTIKPLMSMLGIHPEDTGFGDREVKEVSFDFKNIGLSLLISKTLRDIFDDEAFFIRDRSTTNSASYIMKRGQIMYEINQEKGVLTLTSEEKNIPYFKRVLFEALLMLEKSVETIKEITDPNKMNELIHDDNPKTEAATFNIIKYMSDERVLMDIKSESKDDIIKELATNLVETNAITQEQFDETLNDILERESTMTTALGDQIAMPHARKCPFIKNITLVFGLAPKGKEFEAVDGKPVNIFVLILSPKDAAEPHVQVLVSLSKVLSKPENRNELLSSKSNIEFTNKFKRMVKESK